MKDSHLIRLLKNGAPDELKRIFWMAAISGLANAGLVELITAASEKTSGGENFGARHLFLYLVAFAIYYISNKAALMQANQTIEELLKDLRLRLADKIRNSELLLVESLGRGDLYTKLSSETKHLSTNFPILVSGFQQLVLLIFCLFYIAYLSLPAFLAIGVVSALGIVIYSRTYSDFRAEVAEVAILEAELVDRLSDITDGFKEIRVNGGKSDAVFTRFEDTANKAEEVTVGVGDRWTSVLIFASVYVYTIMGVVVFVLPQLLSGYDDSVFKLTAATLFCIGPIIQLAALAPLATQAEVGLIQLDHLEKTLDDNHVELAGNIEELSARFQQFENISYQGMTFSYRDTDGTASFTSGPWDLDLKKGESLFIVGGNGAGKSTMLKLAVGLYPQDAGTIKVDGKNVTRSAIPGLRELFSCIFADFHLFDRLYGLENIKAAKVTEMIETFGLAEKVRYEDGGFSTLELSTGQRKRLAIIASLLEDRAIYIFDEPTADQDAWFRDIFFDSILPDLKKRGKTVLCVTHDDRYWNRADRLVRLYLGEISAVNEKA